MASWDRTVSISHSAVGALGAMFINCSSWRRFPSMTACRVTSAASSACCSRSGPGVGNMRGGRHKRRPSRHTRRRQLAAALPGCRRPPAQACLVRSGSIHAGHTHARWRGAVTSSARLGAWPRGEVVSHQRARACEVPRPLVRRVEGAARPAERQRQGLAHALVVPLRLLEPLRGVGQLQRLGRVGEQRVPREAVRVGLDTW